MGLHERFIAHRGSSVELRLAAGVQVSGRIADAGSDWLLVHDHGERGSLVPFGAIVAINGLGTRAAAARARRWRSDSGRVMPRADSAATPRWCHWSTSWLGDDGTIDAVDAVDVDALDLSEQPVDGARRSEDVLSRRVVPFAAIVVVRHG